MGLDQHDAATGRRLRRVAFAGGMIAIGEGRLWALEYDGTLRQMNPSDGRQDRSTELNQSVGSLAIGAGAVWIGGGPQDPGITRIDPSSVAVSWHRTIPFD